VHFVSLIEKYVRSATDYGRVRGWFVARTRLTALDILFTFDLGTVFLDTCVIEKTRMRTIGLGTKPHGQTDEHYQYNQEENIENPVSPIHLES
jgi:hypothetical protein